jgi:hypothetical protein
VKIDAYQQVGNTFNHDRLGWLVESSDSEHIS